MLAVRRKRSFLDLGAPNPPKNPLRLYFSKSPLVFSLVCSLPQIPARAPPTKDSAVSPPQAEIFVDFERIWDDFSKESNVSDH